MKDVLTDNRPDRIAFRARWPGLGVAWGLVNGIVLTLGLWLALAELALLILR